jgi:hypothetical protein
MRRLALIAALALAACSGAENAAAPRAAVDPARQFDLACTDVLRRVGRQFTFGMDLVAGQWRDGTGQVHPIVSNSGGNVVLVQAADGTAPTVNLASNTLYQGGSQPTTVAANCRRAPFTPFASGGE